MNGYNNPANGHLQPLRSALQAPLCAPNGPTVPYYSNSRPGDYQSTLRQQGPLYVPPLSPCVSMSSQGGTVGLPGSAGTGVTINKDVYNNQLLYKPLAEPKHDLTQHPTYLKPPQLLYDPGNQSSNQPITPTALTDQMKNLQFKSPESSESTVDLMQRRNLFINETKDYKNRPKTIFSANCDENVMQCTLNMLPMEASMLTKSRLPLGLHIQPFRDTDITVVQTNTIVRCRSCRTYINPFVTLTDNQRRWHCNVCGRVNDLPDEFMYDPISKTYGSPTKRPELQFSNIEYTANPDYTVRPPMAAMYIFCFDVSQAAISSGYLQYICDILIENIDKIPGDTRRQIAFLTYNSSLHYYQIQENRYKMIVWPDISEVELPVSEDLLVSINERREIIIDFLHNLPSVFATTETTVMDSGNCLGYAIQVAMKLIAHNGGRISIINSSMPNVGPGALSVRDVKENDSKLIQPATDFYKSLALQCANDQISVDLFCINRQYTDIATFATITRHSSGGFHYYGNFKAVVAENQRLESVEQLDFDRFTKDFRRYLTRKIGFEAVMRTRFSKGLELTAFYGNLFMRSTNVIALPVVNPDASYAIQFKINSSLTEWNYVIVQAALLYTTSDSDRRIRVHTLCLPLSSKLDQVFHHANAEAITGLIAKIAVDKCASDGLGNVREAFVNSLVDPLKSYQSLMSSSQGRGTHTLLCPHSLRLLPAFILGLLRNRAFRADKSPSAVDERVAMLESLRSLPLTDTLRRIYPRMVALHQLADNISLLSLTTANRNTGEEEDEDDSLDCPEPPVLNLTSAAITRDGAFLMDVGECFYLFLGDSVPQQFLKFCFGIDTLAQLPKEGLVVKIDGTTNIVCRRFLKLHRLIGNNRSLGTSVITVLPNCSLRGRILSHLVEDRMENSMSYYEFLKSVQSSLYS